MSAAAERLALGLQALGLELESSRQQKLLAHLDLISRWNRVYNLTAVRDPAEMLTHHLLDSLAIVGPLARHVATCADAHLHPASRPPFQVLDVGSGAGLPGVTLAIALTGEAPIHITCVDAVLKKVGFIRQVAGELGLRNLSALHGRIEVLRGPPANVITCRAFASLVDIVRLTAVHLAPGGVWMVMKGQDPVDEMKALPHEIEVFHVEPLQVPFLEAQRCLVWMRPRKQSPQRP